jgi:hypothetical protein
MVSLTLGHALKFFGDQQVCRRCILVPWTYSSAHHFRDEKSYLFAPFEALNSEKSEKVETYPKRRVSGRSSPEETFEEEK